MSNKNTSSDESITDLYGSLAPGQFYRRERARLTGEADSSLLKVSTKTDELHEAYHTFDKAHIVMLAEMGILTDDIASSLLDGLKEMERAGHIEIREQSGYGCHAGEAYLIENLSEDIGGWIHVGRSTRDLREVGKRMVAREKLLSLIEGCLDLCETYVDRADKYVDAVVPTYTRFQHAQVTTFGFHLISLERPLERDIQRLWDTYSRLNNSPAGTAAGTGTDFPIDRNFIANLLGFESVADNATDVDKSSDVHLEGCFVPVFILHNIAVASELFLLWSSEEFDLLKIPDELCGTSSIMPQKKNPLGLVGVKNNVNDAIGEAVSQLIASRSFGDRGSISLSALDSASNSLEKFDEILQKATFDRETGENLVYEDWALATDLASLLVREANLPWRSAHQITAILCRESIEANKSITDIKVDDISAVAEAYLNREIAVREESLDSVLDASRAIEAREGVIGSPAPNQVRNQIHKTETFIQNQREQFASERERINEADEHLTGHVDTYITSR